MQYKACGFCANVQCANKGDVDSKSIELIVEHFKVLNFWQSPLVTMICGVFVFTFMKDVDDDGPILCEFH